MANWSEKNWSCNVQVITIVFVDNINLNKIIYRSANSLHNSRYSNEAVATLSTKFCSILLFLNQWTRFVLQKYVEMVMKNHKNYKTTYHH